MFEFQSDGKETQDVSSNRGREIESGHSSTKQPNLVLLMGKAEQKSTPQAKTPRKKAAERTPMADQETSGSKLSLSKSGTTGNRPAGGFERS